MVSADDARLVYALRSACLLIMQARRQFTLCVRRLFVGRAGEATNRCLTIGVAGTRQGENAMMQFGEFMMKSMEQMQTTQQKMFEVMMRIGCVAHCRTVV